MYYAIIGSDGTYIHTDLAPRADLALYRAKRIARKLKYPCYITFIRSDGSCGYVNPDGKHKAWRQDGEAWGIQREV